LESGNAELAPGYPANYLLLKPKGTGTNLLVYYWNIQQGRWLAEGGNARLYKLISIYQGIRLHRSDWALIRLITPVNNNKQFAERRLSDFAQNLITIFPHFIREERVTK